MPDADNIDQPESRSETDQPHDDKSHTTIQSNEKLYSHQDTGQSDERKHPATDQSEDMINKSHETVMLMPEYLVVCCWRSVKEISLILGQLTKDVPVDTNDDHIGLLTHRQVSNIYVESSRDSI